MYTYMHIFVHPYVLDIHIYTHMNRRVYIPTPVLFRSLFPTRTHTARMNKYVCVEEGG